MFGATYNTGFIVTHLMQQKLTFKRGNKCHREKTKNV